MGKNKDRKQAAQNTAAAKVETVAKATVAKEQTAPVVEATTVEIKSEVKTPKVENKTEQKVKEKAKSESIEMIATEDAGDDGIRALNATTGKAVAAKAKVMSPDSKVNLACLMQKRFIDNPDATMKYSQAFLNEADNLIDNIALLAILDLREECIEKGLDLNTEINGNRVFQVEEACKMLGITLPKPKLLPEGQQSFNFVDAIVDTNIDNAVKEDRQTRKKIVEKLPELDPSKIENDEQVVMALEHQLRSAPNGIKGLIIATDWLRDYTLFKTNKPEEKPALKLEPIGYWIEEILKLVKPTLLLTGIGRSIYVNIAQDGNPLSGHAVTHNQTLDENRTPLLTEEQIANLVTILLQKNVLFILEKEPEEMKGKSIADDRAMQALLRGSETLIDKIMSQEEPTDKKAYAMIRNAYFPVGKKYIDLESQMRNKIGQILNLYLPISERMEQYPDVFEVRVAEEADPAQETEKKN